MKKIWAMLLMVVMVFSIVGCSKSNEMTGVTGGVLKTDTENVNDADVDELKAEPEKQEKSTIDEDTLLILQYQVDAAKYRKDFWENIDYAINHIYEDALDDEEIKNKTLESIKVSKETLNNLQGLEAPKGYEEVQKKIIDATDSLWLAMSSWEICLESNISFTPTLMNEDLNNITKGGDKLKEAFDDMNKLFEEIEKDINNQHETMESNQ